MLFYSQPRGFETSWASPKVTGVGGASVFPITPIRDPLWRERLWGMRDSTRAESAGLRRGVSLRRHCLRPATACEKFCLPRGECSNGPGLDCLGRALLSWPGVFGAPRRDLIVRDSLRTGLGGFAMLLGVPRLAARPPREMVTPCVFRVGRWLGPSNGQVGAGARESPDLGRHGRAHPGAGPQVLLRQGKGAGDIARPMRRGTGLAALRVLARGCDGFLDEENPFWSVLCVLPA